MNSWRTPFDWVQRHARVVAGAIWLTFLLLLIVSHVLTALVFLGHVPGVHLAGHDMLFGLVMSAGQFALLTFGVLIVFRWPRHTIGWLFCVVGLLDGVQGFGFAYELFAGARSLPLLTWVVWLANIPDVTSNLVLLIVVPYLFPDGRLLSRRWWPLLAVSFTIIVVVMLHGAFGLKGVGNDPRQVNTNPAHIAAVASILGYVEKLGVVAAPLALLGAVTSLGVRFLRASGVERLQLRWLLWMVGLVIAATLTFLVGEIVAPSVINTQDEWKLPELVLGVSILIGITCGIPAVLGLSILRYRLYSIDLIIHRTLVYGALSLGLAATYGVSVVLLQHVIDPLTGSSDVAVAGSTLAVAALFRPFRRRIQRVVDRHFYRTKYDARRIVESFSTTMRNQVDLDHLQAELVLTVTEAIRPASISLWLRKR